MTYTIQEIASLAGVTTRTLRYYDQIGLLSPAEVGQNGYRYYDRESLFRLQQILFFRELDVPLSEIEAILEMPGFDRIQSLENHRQALQQRAQRLGRLIHTIDQSIQALKGETEMSDKQVFNGFDESQYEDEARERWGDTKMYKQSTQRWNSYTPAQKQALKEQGKEITLRMVGQAGDAPTDPAIQQAVQDYYDYLTSTFYDCEPEFLRNLSDMWVQDSRFARNYDDVREGGAAFVRQAVQHWCDTQKG